ncbi:helix-turn-helix transcriptional regulator [Paenibacillus sp. FSL R7-0331]|uniref:helix-turn-helix transcriptional regulator n=1 Tax=Paenibacillus sp. FSL R7-0331 TaxID=1536773 RepID=UPI0004F5BCE9|nr:AraC family transcriptional regulator [Paenibacillus sp. FSL R7-0331]AIQ54371.1 AraC family transcriptional regulator [Paenibacillus sp. FSL R7-0331]
MMLNSAKYIKFPFGFWSGVQQLGIAPAEIARQARLPLSIIKEPKVSAAEYFAVWQAFEALAPDIAEGITGLVTSFETVHYPPDVLATYHARDYRDALHRMARYKQMCPPERLNIAEEGADCIIGLEWQHSEVPVPQILVGVTLAYLLELGRRGTGQAIKARAVEFSHPAVDVAALEAYFGCIVQTGTGRNRLILRRSDLDLPFTTYNEELLAILTPALDRTLNEQQGSPTVAETVKWIIRRSLMGGHYDIQAVARELNMSDRTLQRRLREEGASFKQLLTQARHEQAREYLSDPSLEIKEVACLVGYEDQNSFYRAFRIWEGATPARWRLEHTVQQEDGVFCK